MKPQPSAKFLSLKTSRLTIGFLAVSSQTIAPPIPRKASTASTRMRIEPNQSQSSPLSIITCMQPSPIEISDRPM